MRTEPAEFFECEELEFPRPDAVLAGDLREVGGEMPPQTSGLFSPTPSVMSVDVSPDA